VSAAGDARALEAIAVRVARAAGELLLARFGSAVAGLATKSSATDLVSDADRDAEALIVSVLRRERPGDAIVAEEGGGGDAGAGRTAVRWMVDPLDGTTNFLWSIPHWGVSVAALDDAGPLAGAVVDPCRGEAFTAARGAGARLNGASLRLGDGPALAEALIGTGFNYDREERGRQGAVAAGLLPDVRDVRRFGSAALDLAWLAAGRLDGYYETGLQPWDWAAGSLLVIEAGGALEEVPLPDGRACVVAARPGLFADLRTRVA
jgi:myo-inositol-1(or 4)-monophosphatase